MPKCSTFKPRTTVPQLVWTSSGCPFAGGQIAPCAEHKPFDPACAMGMNRVGASGEVSRRLALAVMSQLVGQFGCPIRPHCGVSLLRLLNPSQQHNAFSDAI